MLPLPPKGSHSDELLFGAEPLPLTLLDPKSEFLPDPVIEEIVTLLLLMSNDALPEYVAEKVTVFADMLAIAEVTNGPALTNATRAPAMRARPPWRTTALAERGTLPRAPWRLSPNDFFNMYASFPATGKSR